MASRLKWTSQEQTLLKNLGNSNQKNKWTMAAHLINEKFPSFRRTPKQCRQKYNNHLIFGDKLSDGNWTTAEDEILFNQYKQKGPKWKIISQSFPAKSQNTIKNRFYGNVRKVVRKLNKIGKQKVSRSFKPIKQKSIIRIIQPDFGFSAAPAELLNQMHILKEKLLDLIQKGLQLQNETEDFYDEQIIKLIKDIHNFNCTCRFFNNKKSRKDNKLRISKKQNNTTNIYEQNISSSEDQDQQQNSQMLNEGDKSGKQSSSSEQINMLKISNEAGMIQNLTQGFQKNLIDQKIDEIVKNQRPSPATQDFNEMGTQTVMLQNVTVGQKKNYHVMQKLQNRKQIKNQRNQEVGNNKFLSQFYKCFKQYCKTKSKQSYQSLLKQN